MAFQYKAPMDWNFLQETIQLSKLMTLPQFHVIMKHLEMKSLIYILF